MDWKFELSFGRINELSDDFVGSSVTCSNLTRAMLQKCASVQGESLPFELHVHFPLVEYDREVAVELHLGYEEECHHELVSMAMDIDEAESLGRFLIAAADERRAAITRKTLRAEEQNRGREEIARRGLLPDEDSCA